MKITTIKQIKDEIDIIIDSQCKLNKQSQKLYNRFMNENREGEAHDIVLPQIEQRIEVVNALEYLKNKII